MSRGLLVRSACAAAALGLLGSPGLHAQSTRDSAGTRIVENERPRYGAAAAWHVPPSPRLRIGGTSGDSVYEFTRISGITVLGDGRTAVADQASGTVRFFDARGRHRTTAGRRGSGPGEFQQILGLWRAPGDTLVVLDLGEIEVFSAAGRHVRRGARTSEQGSFIYPAAFMTTAEYVGIDWNAGPRSGPPTRTDTLPLIHVSRDGATRRVVTRVPARVGDPMAGSLPYAPSVLVASGSGVIWYAFGERSEVMAYGLDGRMTTLVRRPNERVAVTSEMRKAYREYFLNATGEDGRPRSPELRARLEQRLDRVPFPEYLPFASALRTDADENVWVRRYDYRVAFVAAGPVRTHTINAPSLWDVFSPDGAWLCTVQLPPRFTPLEIGRTHIAGVRRDEDDVEFVEVFDLVKPPQSAR